MTFPRITCGMYIQISIHDYLRALMGFHNYNTNFTLDPRTDIKNHTVTRGLGNQVTVEFNLLYRFHCAISLKDEKYAEEFLREQLGGADPKTLTMDALREMTMKSAAATKPLPNEQDFGLQHVPELHFTRDSKTHLFDDQQMVTELIKAMDDSICEFGRLPYGGQMCSLQRQQTSARGISLSA
jgi:hypothetical protein